MLFAFKHMDRSPAVEEAARAAFQETFDKFAQAPTSASVTFSVNSKFQSVHLSAHLRDGLQIELEQGEDEIYKSIDGIAEKLHRELSKHKGKMLGHRHDKVELKSEEEE